MTQPWVNEDGSTNVDGLDELIDRQVTRPRSSRLAEAIGDDPDRLAALARVARRFRVANARRQSTTGKLTPSS